MYWKVLSKVKVVMMDILVSDVNRNASSVSQLTTEAG